LSESFGAYVTVHFRDSVRGTTKESGDVEMVSHILPLKLGDYGEDDIYDHDQLSASPSFKKKESSSLKNIETRRKQTSVTSNADKTILYKDLEFVEKIGQGGFGEVWHGLWRATDVAIKKGQGTEKAILEMEKEAASWLEISDHKNILRKQNQRFFGNL